MDVCGTCNYSHWGLDCKPTYNQGAPHGKVYRNYSVPPVLWEIGSGIVPKAGVKGCFFFSAHMNGYCTWSDMSKEMSGIYAQHVLNPIHHAGWPVSIYWLVGPVGREAAKPHCTETKVTLDEAWSNKKQWGTWPIYWDCKFDRLKSNQ